MKKTMVKLASILFATLLTFQTFAFLGGSSANVARADVQSQAAVLVQKDVGIAQTYQSKTKMINAPTVVAEVTDKTALDALKTTKRAPSNVILHLDKNANVVGTDGNKIGGFLQIYNDSLKGKIIPVVYVENEDAAKALINVITTKLDILDLAVMSSDPALVKQVREKCVKIRGIVEITEAENDYNDIVKVANESRANIVVLSQELADNLTVAFVQARANAVWVRTSTQDKIDMYDAVGSGAYGMVVTDYEKAYDVLESFEKNSYARMPMITAHRGMGNKVVENSIEGLKLSAKHGATHIELDIQVTTDNKAVVMHDLENIVRTTNCTDTTKKTEEYSSEELKAFKLKNGEDIPMLEDFLAAAKGLNIVVIIEIKTLNANAAELTMDAIKSTGMQEWVATLNSNETINGRLTNGMPELPKQGLATYTKDNFADALTAWNTTCCVPNMQGGGTGWDTGYMRDRGYLNWGWNYAAFNIDSVIKSGLAGISNDDADAITDRIRFYNGVEFDAEGELNIGDEVAVKGVTYGGEEKELKGKVFYMEDKGDKYEVIATFTEGGMTFYTQKFTVTHPTSGWVLWVAIGGGVVVVAGAVIVTLMLLKKKKGLKTETVASESTANNE